MSNTTYTIGQAADITGVTSKQIRNWEKQGLLPDVEYVSYGRWGHRRFSQKNVDLIIKIKGFLDEGFTLRAASKKALETTVLGGD